MREHLERTESDLRQQESATEQIEQRMEEIEQKIEQIEAAISRLAGRGDQEIAASLQRNLAERKQEKTREEHRAREVYRALEDVRHQIEEVDKWNQQAHQEITKLEQLGENVGDAAIRVSDRERWVSEQETRRREAQRRLARLGAGQRGG